MNDPTIGLVDIFEPMAPLPDAGSNPIWPVTGIVLIVFLVAGLIVWWRKRQPYRLMEKRLQALRHISRSEALTRHEMVYLIALELRRGLNLARLLPDEIPAAFQGDDLVLWPDFVRRLDALRYQPEIAMDESQLEALLTQTETWLRRYCR